MSDIRWQIARDLAYTPRNNKLVIFRNLVYWVVGATITLSLCVTIETIILYGLFRLGCRLLGFIK